MKTFNENYFDELKLQRGTFVFILSLMAKAAGGTRDDSTPLAPETVASILVRGRAGQGIACVLTLYDKIIYIKMLLEARIVN